MTEPWNFTEAQRRQFREAHAAAKVSEQEALAWLGQLAAPTNKRKPWRVFGPGEQFEDRPSENKAYELVRSLVAAGETVTVYVYENGRWLLFEHLEPVRRIEP